MADMKTIIIDGVVYTVVDETARAELAKCLPLTGGTIKTTVNNQGPLTIWNPYGEHCVLYYKTANGSQGAIGHYAGLTMISNEKSYARIGVTDAGIPQYWSNNKPSNAKTLIHTGNVQTAMDAWGLQATAAELNYCKGLTKNLQEQLDELRAMIESGGGSGGETAEAFTVSVQDESYYGEAEYIDLGEGGPYAYKVSDTVPTMEQMQACNFEGYFGEATYDMTAPQVEDDWSYYRIKFTEFEGTAITSSTPQIIVPKPDFSHTMGVYVCFDGCEDAYNKATGGTSTMSSGTISFPEV